MKDLVRNILLALVLLGEAKGSKILDLRMVDKFFQEIYNPQISKSSPAEGFWRDRQSTVILLFGIFEDR